ncbi:MspA family porin [Nocardia altamirensis]|uniref:MspA family porin n=1 Tax=Nocardia altamirensis TaxID=472158 RepID=UPI00083FF81A|nr:MspA family porin [Nocardia altamirensis]
MINRQQLTRATGLAATVAISLLAIGPAEADIVIPLPGGEITKTLVDGTVVTIRLVGESVAIGPPVAATPNQRSARVAGSGHVEFSGDAQGAGGSIFPGYTVACQADVAMNGTVDGGGETIQPKVEPATGGNLSLGLGEAISFYVADLEQADSTGSAGTESINAFKGNSGAVAWDETIGLSGCDGYVQARSFVSLSVETDSVVTWVTLWGKPFILG